MNIIEIDGMTVTLEFQTWELALMADMARLAEVAIERNYDLDTDDPPAYLQHREDLQLITGLWKSLCRVIGMSADRALTFSQWRYQELRYLAARAKKRGDDMAELAEEAFPEEAALYREHQEKWQQKRVEMDYAPRPEPRPTDQQNGELKGEALEQFIGSEQVVEETEAHPEGGAK